jgi:hypothetical protein
MIWKDDTQSWQVFSEVDGPGGITEIPKQCNASGFRVQPRKAVFLGIGIVLVLFGMIAFIVLILGRKGAKSRPKGSKKTWIGAHHEGSAAPKRASYPSGVEMTDMSGR